MNHVFVTILTHLVSARIESDPFFSILGGTLQLRYILFHSGPLIT